MFLRIMGPPFFFGCSKVSRGFDIALLNPYDHREKNQAQCECGYTFDQSLTRVRTADHRRPSGTMVAAQRPGIEKSGFHQGASHSGTKRSIEICQVNAMACS